MKTQVYFGIAFRIILLFGCGMLATYIPDNLREFFGDESCDGRTYKIFNEVKQGCYSPWDIDSEWEWGTRHYWYAWLTVLLFILSLINVGVSIYNLIDKYYLNTSQTLKK